MKLSNMHRSDFPDTFEFGVATSAYQIEGHGFGNAGRTHWDDFAATPGNVAHAENGLVGCDHYHRYNEDFDLIQAAGFDSYRFSTSWARVMPDGRGAVNQKGLDFYDRLADALLKRNIKPCATLYHWELPSTLSDLGGWRNPDIAHWFADFTDVIMRRIGDRMHSVAPINEPWCVSWLSHFLGQHAPGLRDIRATARAMHHVLLAHGQAIGVMRGLGMQNLGVIFNMEWANPANTTEEGLRAAQVYDAYYNRFFIGGVMQGKYPELALEGLEPHLPDNWQDDFPIITEPVDWCGLNYYTRKNIHPTTGSWPAHEEVDGPLQKTEMGWEIYPTGLSDFLIRTAKEYTADMPIYVTENGLANNDTKNGDMIVDTLRSEYIARHLHEVLHALKQGIPVAGYYIWSLLDNYEWALGYDKRFGLIHVDFESLKRTPKESYYKISDFLTS